ncbi:hypothetical protein [Paenibacillus sp. L3-i20]|uniref:hypothetical protein n=1 Tax=Paenibacillus sp. L3-i20 TaxID=2905833 RepID=UPI001EE11336|nr:hypothetical protein [Paenibacillus sp. L3-i20]
MKKITIVLLLTLLSLSLAACETSSNKNKLVKHEDLKIFLQTVKLPSNLSLSFDAGKVKSPTSAKTYSVNFMEFDPELVSQQLLRREIVEKKPMAEGPWYQTGDKSLQEFLIVFDGGKGFNIKDGVNGGLSYVTFKEGSDRKPTVIVSNAGPPNVSEQLDKSQRRSDYTSFADLSFMSYVDALTSAEKQLKDLNFPKVSVAEAYSMDVETMQEHFDSYVNDPRNSEENLKGISWSKDDEQYMIHFRQIIDNIPVTNVSWQWGNGTATGAAGNAMKDTNISVKYSKDGINTIHAANIYNVETAKVSKEEQLISAADALQVLLNEYAELILEKGTTVTTAELVYVSIPKDDNYELIPAWTFSVAKPQLRIDQTNGTKTPYNDYSHYVVNAITGQKMSDMR